MQKRPLGTNGPSVSVVGIGAMSFAGVYGNATVEESHAVLAAALDMGIDHIDTANVYGLGRSEEIIGSFLAKQGSRKNDMFTIATKAAITRDADGNRVINNTKQHITAELDGSLKRLGIDSVELLYIHRRDPAIPIEDVTETLAGLVESGKVRRIGYSEIAPSSLRRAAAIHPIAAVQSEYSLGVRSPELGLVQTCAELGTALVAFSPVGRGMLTDEPRTPQVVEEIDFLRSNPRFQQPNLSANLAATERFRKLARDMGTTTASLAIAWVLHKDPNSITIPGTRSVDHLRELVAGAELTLSPGDMAGVENVLPVGWASGDRYSTSQWIGPERYC